MEQLVFTPGKVQVTVRHYEGEQKANSIFDVGDGAKINFEVSTGGLTMKGSHIDLTMDRVIAITVTNAVDSSIHV